MNGNEIERDQNPDTGGASSTKDNMGNDESDEAKTNKGLPFGTKPSQREIEEHERTHLPFRSWCKHRVMGRAQRTPHYHRDHSEDKVPTISWDYWFIDEEQDKNKDNEEEKGRDHQL